MEDKESWKKVLDAGRLLASNLDIGSLLRAITKLSAEVANAESASLLLLDPETQELYFDIGLGLKEEAKKIRLKIGQGIAGSVLGICPGPFCAGSFPLSSPPHLSLATAF